MSRLKLPLELLGPSAAAEWARACAEHAASCSEHLLIRVDQGMSAERVARAVHDADAGPDGPFVSCDCAAGLWSVVAGVSASLRQAVDSKAASVSINSPSLKIRVFISASKFRSPGKHTG